MNGRSGGIVGQAIKGPFSAERSSTNVSHVCEVVFAVRLNRAVVRPSRASGSNTIPFKPTTTNPCPRSATRSTRNDQDHRVRGPSVAGWQIKPLCPAGDVRTSTRRANSVCIRLLRTSLTAAHVNTKLMFATRLISWVMTTRLTSSLGESRLIWKRTSHKLEFPSVPTAIEPL